MMDREKNLGSIFTRNSLEMGDLASDIKTKSNEVFHMKDSLV
jgi:hypothetical protein